MSGRIPGNSTNPYQYSAYPERPSSRQSNAQCGSMQRPPSRSGAFSTSEMYSALPRLHTNFVGNSNAALTSPYSARSHANPAPLMNPSRPPSRSGVAYRFPSPSPVSSGGSVNRGWMNSPSRLTNMYPRSPVSASSVSSDASSGMYIPQSASRTSNLYNMPPRPLSRSGNTASQHLASGSELTEVRQLTPTEQERFLNKHDPLRSMPGLNANTSLYRGTERRYIRDGQISGNPESMASIARHDKLVPNQIGRHVFHAPLGTAEAYLPASAHAHELGPSLNVMIGAHARELARAYGKKNPDNVVVKMKLGDFLQRGGKVYLDTGAAVGDGSGTVPLIVTLPRSQTVPVEIIR